MDARALGSDNQLTSPLTISFISIFHKKAQWTSWKKKLRSILRMNTLHHILFSIEDRKEERSNRDQENYQHQKASLSVKLDGEDKSKFSTSFYKISSVLRPSPH